MSKYIPNAFQMPNIIIDEYMARLSGNAFKAYALVTRKTTGWQKELDYIPISQFKEKCGIKKPETVTAVIKELKEIGLIICIEAKGKVTGFKLNFSFEATPDERVYPTNGATPDDRADLPPMNGGTTPPDERGTSKPTTKPTILKPNYKENKKEKTAISIEDLVHDYDIDKQIASDWFIARKNRKAGQLTKTALTRVINEAEKANLALSDVIQKCAERNWASFSAEWLLQKNSYTPAKQEAFDPVAENNKNRISRQKGQSHESAIDGEFVRVV